MFAKLRNLVLWQYPETTSVETLLGHRRWAMRLVYTWSGSGVLAFSSMAHFVLSSEGILRTITMVLMCASAGICLLLFVPGIAAMPWASDIEKALRARGYRLPTADPVVCRVGIAAMKMGFWWVALLLVANLLSKSSHRG